MIVVDEKQEREASFAKLAMTLLTDCLRYFVDEQPNGHVSVSMPWTDDVLAGIVACGGTVERALSMRGYYAYATVDLGRVRIYSCGPHLQGPHTLEELETIAHHLRSDREAAERGLLAMVQP